MDKKGLQSIEIYVGADLKEKEKNAPKSKILETETKAE
jgi:hypothetical protein